MTKKSAARLTRDSEKKIKDEYFKKNTIFTDLNEIHEKIVAQIRTFGVISTLSNQPELVDKLENKEDINNKVRLLALDLSKIISDLNDNYQSHKGKTGGTDDPDEHMQALIIFNNYLQIVSVVEGVIMPTAGSIMEAFTKAEVLLNKEPSIVA